MKYKTTKKAIMNGFGNVICVGDCTLQTLLSHETETAYTSRREGWAADIYDFGNTAIVTGYAPFGNVHPDYEICQKYEKEAKKIRCDYSLEWEARKEKLYTLIEKFIKEVTTK